MSASAADFFDREYQALRTGEGFVELTGWSSISVSGADRQPFLHNFCTNDVKRLVPGACCESFFCNGKGKIVGHGVVSCRDEELVILGPPAQANQLVEHLDRYIIREDVQLSNNTDTRTYVFIVSDVSFSTASLSWDLVGHGVGRILEVASSEASVLRSTLRDQKLVSVGERAFTAARIEAGFPLFGVDFNEENFPQEIGRNFRAISFTKGCYLGQETVARIDALGHVNQQIVGVRFDGELPERGTELTLNGAKIGVVTSVSFSPKLAAPLALAMVRRGANSPGTRLKSVSGDCEVVVLPVV